MSTANMILYTRIMKNARKTGPENLGKMIQRIFHLRTLKTPGRNHLV